MTFPSLNSKDILSLLSRLSDNSNFHDISLVCRDGIVKWNKFLLCANSTFLTRICSDISPDIFDEPIVVILPDISSSTLSTMLNCTLDYNVRRDILSVNEQQVMSLLGFTLLLNKTNSSSMPSVVNLVPSSSRQEVDNISEDLMNGVEEDHLFSDIPFQTMDFKPDLDSISMDVIAPTEMFVIKPVNSTENLVVVNHFKCNYCDKSFQRQLHLDEHVANHERTESFVCDLCGKIFFHNSLLKSHKRYHLDTQREFKCKHCDRSFKGKRALNNHFQEVHNTTKCLQCPEKVLRKNLKSHLQSRHGGNINNNNNNNNEKSFYCHVCEKRFKTSRGLMVHRRSHEDHNGFIEPRKNEFVHCEICKKLFACQKHLDEHLSSHHEETECQVCGKMVRNLKKHQKNVHSPGTLGSSNKFSSTKCPSRDCSLEFSTFYAAKYHCARVHGQVSKQKEVCHICDKAYFNLKRHQAEVHGENRFECRICGHFFPVKQSLERHVQNVHKSAKKDCPYCEKSLVHLLGHLVKTHKMKEDHAKDIESSLTGKESARTDLQWTAFSQKLE